MIDPTWVQAHEGLIMQVLKGGAWLVQGAAERNSSRSDSAAKFLDPDTGETLNQYVYDWNEGRKENPSLKGRKNLVAMLSITGPIMKYDGGCGEPGTINYSNQLRGISQMKNVSQVILLLDTPGGQVDGLHTLGQTLTAMPQHTIAFVDDGMACSAGMYIAAHCKEIVASKATDTVGSVGVLTTLAKFDGWYEKEGIQIKTIYAPQSTEKNLDWKEAMENDNPALIEAQLERTAAHFIQVVSGNRPKAARHADKWNKGATFFADEAVKIGLVDRIASLQDVLKKAARSSGSRANTATTMTTENKAMTAVLQAAGAEQFAVVAAGDTVPDGGFVLSEAHIGSIASALEAAGTTQASAIAELERQLQAATDRANAAEANATTLQGQLATAIQSLTDAQAQVTSLEQERTTLQAQVAELGKGSSGQGSHIKPAGSTDPHPGGKKQGRYKDDGSMALLEKATASTQKYLDSLEA